MANGVYGTKKPALVTPSDVDIYYYYRPSRSSEATGFENFKKLDSNLLANTKAPLSDDTDISVLPGMYDMRLPLNVFGKVGIYTIYIKPKEVYGKIIDVSTLAAYPNISGIVLDSTDFVGGDNSMFANGALQGYRVEFFDKGNRIDKYRIITSNNKCEPVAQNMNDSTAKGIRYRFNDSSNLVFCTVTPSMALSFNSSSKPDIGKVNDKIALVSTKFNPVMLEIEMVQHDIDSLYALQTNTQIRDLDKGVITTFDDDGNIIEQALYGNITNPARGINHDFKIKNDDNISFDQETDLQNIIRNI
jgi:hypothetical protein